MKDLAERAWGPESRDVRVTGMRTVGDRLWVEVELITGHDCGSVGAGVVRVRGWIPAHAPSGDLNVWYDPRGCQWPVLADSVTAATTIDGERAEFAENTLGKASAVSAVSAFERPSCQY